MSNKYWISIEVYSVYPFLGSIWTRRAHYINQLWPNMRLSYSYLRGYCYCAAPLIWIYVETTRVAVCWCRELCTIRSRWWRWHNICDIRLADWTHTCLDQELFKLHLVSGSRLYSVNISLKIVTVVAHKTDDTLFSSLHSIDIFWKLK